MKSLAAAALLLMVAFTLSPASYTTTTTQDDESSFNLNNPSDDPINLVITERGSVAQLLDISRRQIRLEPGQQETINYEIDVDSNQLPGLYNGGIIVEQVADGNPSETVQALPAAQHSVNVRIPNDGQFLEVKILTSQPRSQEPVVISTIMENVGTDLIREISVRLEVRSGSNELVQTQRFSQGAIESGKNARLTYEWTPPSPGTYLIEAVAEYAGKTSVASTQIEVGTFEIRLGEIILENQRLGEIIPVNMEITSDWNRRINSINAEFQVSPTGEGDSQTFFAPSVQLAPRGTATVRGFWNTAGLLPGSYDITATLRANDKTFTKTQQVILGSNEVEEEKVALNVILGLIIILAIILFVAVKLIQRERKEN